MKIKSQNSYEPSVKACRINLEIDSKHICVISCRFVEPGPENEKKSQNSYEPSVNDCRINLGIDYQFIYV